MIAAACGWSALDPLAPVSRRAADPAFLDLWSAVAHRVGHQQFVALPTLALLNWSPERKPRRALPIDQLARTEPLVPVVRWSPEGQPLGPLDRLSWPPPGWRRTASGCCDWPGHSPGGTRRTLPPRRRCAG